MKEKRNTTMLIIITIAVFLVAVIGATFAYFATEREVGNAINANVGTAASMYSFSATSPDKIEMNIAFNEMSQASVSNVVLKSDNANITVSLSSPTDDTLTTCTYDIVWVWEDGDMYTTPDIELPGHKIAITEAQYNDINYTCRTGYNKRRIYDSTNGIYNNYCQSSKTYNYEFSTKVDDETEIDLSKLTTSGNKVKLQSGLSITSDSTAATTKTHTIVANIYNLPVEQTNLFNKKFKAHVTIDNLSCSMEEVEALQVTSQEGTLAYYLMNNVYKSEENQTNISNKSAGLYYHNNALISGANDKTLRYAGADADVNNYVCFLGDDCVNNLYRIISVDSETNQTKVIKATSLGNMPWDDNTDGTSRNVWENASLQKYLNGTYLTELKSKTNKIIKTTWHVGGLSDINQTPQAIYEIEKADTTTYEKEIGLMYASEYVFAALPEYWTNTVDHYNLSKGKDWMLTSGNPWTISRYSGGSSTAFTVISGSGGVRSFSVHNDNGVRPSFVLSSDVKITNAGDGVGTADNPMIIN